MNGFENLETYENRDLDLVVQKKAKYFHDNIKKKPEMILKFGFYETSLANKTSKIKTFYDNYIGFINRLIIRKSSKNIGN